MNSNGLLIENLNKDEEEMNNTQYPQEFKDAVKNRFPHWQDMHQWLEWGDSCVWPYLGVKAPDIYNQWHKILSGVNNEEKKTLKGNG